MGKPQNSEAPKGVGFRRREYRREYCVYVDVRDNKVVKAGDVIEAIEQLCGEGSIYACISKSGNMYEVTMKDELTTNILLDGLNCNGKTFECTPVANDRVLVSFLEIPTYMPDYEIMSKLDEMNVEVISPINRKCRPGTKIEDGTRMCTVKLPQELKSLPYFMKLHNGYTINNYRVVHDNQKKMCNNCFSLTHFYRDCPEITCHRCKNKGHFKFHCNAKKCGLCYKYRCECTDQIEPNKQNENENQNEWARLEDEDLEDEIEPLESENNEINCEEESVTENVASDIAPENNDVTDNIGRDDTSEVNTSSHLEDNCNLFCENDTDNAESRETVFGDIFGNADDKLVKSTPDSPNTSHCDSENDDRTTANSSTDVEMCSVNQRKRRPSADDKDYATQRLPAKLRVQSPGKKK